MKEIYYTLDRKDDHYVIWKNIETRTGCNLIFVYSGTRQECIDYAKENNITFKRVS